MSSERKTVEIQKVIDYANGYLAAKGGSIDCRRAIISMVEAVLMAANRYRGYRYLGQNELEAGDLPGIRWENDPKDYLTDTDDTRRFYA